MADAQTSKKPALFLAEFNTPDEIIEAAEKVRDEGYESWDVHTPFPVHGMDKAMGLGDSGLGWLVLVCGLTGVSLAVTMMQYMNGFDYPLIIGGKPPDAYASMVPIMFELTVLVSAFGSLLGMLHFNRLPRHHHPVFYSDRFDACSTDKFYVSIEAEDKKFDADKTKAFLESLNPAYLELVEEGDD